ncbi:MAG: hypothetical protein ACRDNZ_19240 [Streptosporangiaceae bacterium]
MPRSSRSLSWKRTWGRFAARAAGTVHPARGVISAGTPESANHYGMEFGPANVGLREVSAAVELADGSLAAAPQLVRVHPMARETVRMIARTDARPSEDPRSFRGWQWLGIES